ncbi:MAG: hypothetical protein AAGI38_22745 [Bacteroidota bacterium]
MESISRISRAVFLILILFVFPQAFSQYYVSNEVEEMYVLEVKQFDEFVERFNFDEQTPAIQYLRDKHPKSPLTREVFIRSLIHSEAQNRLVNEFVEEVCNASLPHFISFYDFEWYAEVQCTFNYNGYPIETQVILQNEVLEDNSSRWIVVGIRENFVPPGGRCDTLPPSENPLACLNPMSHATGFIGLRRAFRDKANLRNYFTTEEWNQSLTYFAHELFHKRLNLVSVGKITYHLLQLDNWIMVVNEYPTGTREAGLRISRLMKSTRKSKIRYKKKKLGLQ